MWEWTDIRDDRATVVEDGGGRALWATVVVCCMVGWVSVRTETRVLTTARADGPDGHTQKPRMDLEDYRDDVRLSAGWTRLADALAR